MPRSPVRGRLCGQGMHGGETRHEGGAWRSGEAAKLKLNDRAFLCMLDPLVPAGAVFPVAGAGAGADNGAAARVRAVRARRRKT